jgi:hypothetical protein
VPEGKGEGGAHATREPRRTEDRLTGEAETRCRGWLRLSVARTGLVGSWEAVAHGADGEEKWGEKGSEVDCGSCGGPVARA